MGNRSTVQRHLVVIDYTIIDNIIVNECVKFEFKYKPLCTMINDLNRDGLTFW